MKFILLISTFFFCTTFLKAQDSLQWNIGFNCHYTESGTVQSKDFVVVQEGGYENLSCYFLYDATIERRIRNYGFKSGLGYYREVLAYSHDCYRCSPDHLKFIIQHLVLPIQANYIALQMKKSRIHLGLNLNFDFRFNADKQSYNRQIPFSINKEKENVFRFHHLEWGIGLGYSHKLFNRFDLSIAGCHYFMPINQTSLFGDNLKYTRFDLYVGVSYLVQP